MEPAFASTSGPTLKAPDITQTFGLMALATIVSSLFYGISLMQTCMYFGNRHKFAHGRRTSFLVIVLLFLDTLSWIMETYSTWWYIVVNYANPAKLHVVLWSLKLEPVFTYSAIFVAQMFFVEKVWALSESRILGTALAILTFAAWGIGLSIAGIVGHDNVIMSPLITKMVVSQKSISLMLEVSISLLMTFLLSRLKGGLTSSDNILNRIIGFMLSRGIVICVVQAAHTVVFFAFPNKLYWVIFHFSLSKVASNSVLALLNVRKTMRSGLSDDFGVVTVRQVKSKHDKSATMNRAPVRGSGISEISFNSLHDSGSLLTDSHQRTL